MTKPEQDEAALAARRAPAGFSGARMARSAIARLRCQAAAEDAIDGYAPGLSGVDEEKRISGFLNAWADRDLHGLCGWLEGAMTGMAVDGWTAAAVERTGERFPHVAFAEGMEILRKRGVAGIRPDELMSIAARLDAASMVAVMEIAVPAGAERVHVAGYAKDFDFGVVATRCMSESDAKGWLDYLPENFVEEWTKREPWKVLAFQNERMDRNLMASRDNGMGDFLESFTMVVSREDAVRTLASLLETPRPGFEMGELGRFLRYEDDRELLDNSFRHLSRARREEAATELLQGVIWVDGWRKEALELSPSAEARLRGVKMVRVADERLFLKLNHELRELGHDEKEIETALSVPGK